MKVQSPFLSIDIPFVSFSQAHLTTLLFSAAVLAVIILIGRRLTKQQNLLLSRAISVFLSFTVVAFIALHLNLGHFDVTSDLPLAICNLFAFLAPLLFWNPNFKRFEVIYFGVMSATFQAIVTPDLYVGFPSYGFFKYWIVHVGLVILVIHYLLSFQLYPRAKGIPITFIWLNIYLLLLMPVNLLLDANYFYMMNKPLNPSILDFFGPWPVYIVVTELLAVGLFALAYLPILAARKVMATSVTILPANH